MTVTELSLEQLCELRIAGLISAEGYALLINAVRENIHGVLK